jgi:DNA-directed RNA polymerase specialized sigma24 family protein
MVRREEPNIADFRADYASRADFCKVLEQELKSLYLLAFVLTANHAEAEQCFARTAEKAVKEQSVFKEFARSWIRRCLIKGAIGMVFPASAVGSEKRDFWSAGRHKAGGDDEIDAITQLPPLERFVFVMSILERYSDWQCSLLLGCSTRKVSTARMRALRRLPGPIRLIPRSEPRASRFVEIPA